MMMREAPLPDRAWIEAHRVCWESQPLREMVKGHGIQTTGTCLRLYARIGTMGGGHALADVLQEVHARCARLLLTGLAGHDPLLRVDLEPFDFTRHLRPESQHLPEVEACARIVADHGGIPDPTLIQATLQRAIADLRERGVHERVWLESHPAPALLS